MISAVILPAVISAASGLLGVAVGGYFTSLNQRRERRHQRVNDQLAEFYSPMLALRAKIGAKVGLQLKIGSLAESAWKEMMTYNSAAEIDKIEKLTKDRGPEFERITQHGNSQLKEVILPAYHQMVELLISKMNLAEPSTIQHFPTLIGVCGDLGPAVPTPCRLRP